MASGVTLDLSRPSDDFRKKERLMIKTVSTDIHFHSPRPRAMVLGSAIAFMFIAPAAVGDVISFNGSGSVGVGATLYDPNDNSNSADVFTDVTPNWNGLSPFDQTSQQQASVGGETLDVSTRLQLDATTANGVTTMAYRETNSMTVSSGVTDPYRDIGFSYNNSIFINFTTAGWTELQFTNIGGGLYNSFFLGEFHLNSGGELYDIDYSSGSGVVGSIPYQGSLTNLDSWVGGTNLLLGAGSWTLELRDSFSGLGDFGDTLNFDMEFSNFVIPGPGGIAAILGLAAVRRRRR